MITTKFWWARIGVSVDKGNYGRWVPTGLVNRAEAEHYVATYHVGQPAEWLLL